MGRIRCGPNHPTPRISPHSRPQVSFRSGNPVSIYVTKRQHFVQFALQVCGQLSIIMPYCSAYGCNTCSYRCGELSFFSFPKETVVLKQWIKKCGRTGWNPTKYSTLCSVHFEEDCFEEDMYHKLMGQDPTKRRRRRLLKPGAVPTIFDHGPKRKPSKPRVFSIKRAEAAERKKVSHCSI